MAKNTAFVIGVVLVLSFAAMSLALPASTWTGLAQKRSAGMDKRDNLDTICKTLGDIPCHKAGQSCACPSYSTGDCAICNIGTTCDDDICQPNPELGDSCSYSSDCDQTFHSLDCNDGVCSAGSDIFSAGENCYPNNPLFYNGGCASGLTCSNTTRTCGPHYAIGDDCTLIEEGCGAGAFCSQHGKCTPSLKEGAVCANETKNYAGDNVCEASLTCFDGKCVKRFSRGEGEPCSSNYLCKAGLYCAEEATRDGPVCQKYEGLNMRCGTNTTVCGAGTYCYCDYQTKDARCIAQMTPRFSKALDKHFQCLAKNGLSDLDSFVGSGEYVSNAIAQKCGKQYEAAILAMRFSGYGEGKYCSSASGMLLSLSAIVLAVLVFLM